jgi:hypothetical protein
LKDGQGLLGGGHNIGVPPVIQIMPRTAILIAQPVQRALHGAQGDHPAMAGQPVLQIG